MELCVGLDVSLEETSKYVFKITIEILSPEVVTCFSIGELGSDSDSISTLTDTTF